MVNKGIISCTSKGQIYGMASAFLFKIDSAFSIYYCFLRRNVQVFFFFLFFTVTYLLLLIWLLSIFFFFVFFPFFYSLLVSFL